MKLLIAEDDKALLRALTAFFRKNNFTVDAVTNGSDALDYLKLGHYDAAILDVMMPEMDGVTVTKKLRAEKNATPVLLLTAKSEVEDRITGLDAGANDYLPKPFDIRELLARVRVLTRPIHQQTNFLTAGNIFLDTASFVLKGPLGAEALPNKEYQCLLLLFHNLGKPLSPDAMMEAVWDLDSFGRENALWTVIYHLRKKLSAIGSNMTIRNKRNLGYVLEAKK
ncbi:MAG: response regulator transcription factor [Clostridia bacterium]|nr:response regulator transcription factor [Clostridia bacterium]